MHTALPTGRPSHAHAHTRADARDRARMHTPHTCNARGRGASARIRRPRARARPLSAARRNTHGSGPQQRTKHAWLQLKPFWSAISACLFDWAADADLLCRQPSAVLPPSLPPSLPRLLWSRCVARSTARSSTAKCEGAKSLKSFTLVLAHGSPGADVSGLVSASALAVQTTPPTPELRLYEPRPKPFAFDQSFGTPGAALSAPATTPAAESAPRRAGPARTPAAPATESANGAVYHL